MNPFLMEILDYLGGVAFGVLIFFVPELLQAKHWFKSFTPVNRIFGKIVGGCIILMSLYRIGGVITNALAALF